MAGWWATAARCIVFFFSSRRRHTRYIGDWSSDVCSSDLDLELVLHGTPFAVRRAVVAEACTLAGEPDLERRPDPVTKAGDVAPAEVPCRPGGVDARMPERFVGVDVPEARERPLVEQRGLD